MEGRKLQLVGGSTFQVSLPRRWVADRGLKAGDLLYIDTERDGTVCVRADAADHAPNERKVFDAARIGSSDHLLRKLIGAYVTNFRLIEVRYPPRGRIAARRVAREFCRLVNGPEIIDETPTHLVLQDFSNGSELSAARCLRRMHLVVRAMLTDSLRTLQDGDPDRARDVELHDEDLNRLFWIVAKLTHASRTNGGPPAPDGSLEAPYLRLVAKLLECIGQDAVELAQRALTLHGTPLRDPGLNGELEACVGEVTARLDGAFEALFGSDSELANDAIDGCLRLREQLEELLARLSKLTGHDLLSVHRVVESLDRSVSHTYEIAKQALDLSVLREPAIA